MYETRFNDAYDNMVRIRPSPIICTTAIRVRLDSSKLNVLNVFRSSPAIGMSPTVILPPAASFRRIEGGGTKGTPTSLSRQEVRQLGNRSDTALPHTSK